MSDFPRTTMPHLMLSSLPRHSVFKEVEMLLTNSTETHKLKLTSFRPLFPIRVFPRHQRDQGIFFLHPRKHECEVA